MTQLGVNVDHVATVRQARREAFPDPVRLAEQAVEGGADGITAHLREDRRHIQDDDIRRLRRTLTVPLNLEMGASPEIVSIAEAVKPEWACLVPEKREELTTEGGLDVVRGRDRLADAARRLMSAGVRVSFFIEPEGAAVDVAKELGASAVELHTGRYAATRGAERERELERIASAAARAREARLRVHAGHGLDYENTAALARRFRFDEFNIGFAIVARALEVGMKSAVREMKEIIKGA